MITLENQLYIRFILLLIKGGTGVLRTLVIKQLEKKRSNLGEFLKSIEETIKSDQHITRKQRELLYPHSSDPPDLNKWDIPLLAYILTTFFIPKTSSHYKDVDTIRAIRNDFLAHQNNASIDANTYVSVWTKLSNAIYTLSHGFKDEEREEIRIMIKNLSSDTLGMDDAVEKLKRLDRSDEFFENIAVQITQLDQLVQRSNQDTCITKIRGAVKLLENILGNHGNSTTIVHTSLLPVEILRMDKNSIALYKQALSEGKEAVHNIRVMVVGHYGVGKTTLTKRLLGEEVDINKRESTNGIDVHVRRCKVSLETGQWKVLDKDQENETVSHRLVKLLKMPFNETHNASSNERTLTHGLKSKGKLPENPHSKKAYFPDAEEEIVDEVPFKTESITLEETAINPKDEYILNHLKEFIEQVHHKSAKEEDSDTADVSVWDFAGQYVFYATHQVFLSRRAVYLLVTDISKNMEDIVKDDDCFLDSKGEYHWKISEFVDFWLNSIHEFCSSTESEGPPVLLVGTFADKLNQETRQKTIDEFFYTLRCSLLHKETSRHLAGEDFALDNSIVDSNIEMLKDQIFNTAAKQPYWGELIPAKWITLENIIVSLKDKGLKVLHKDKLHDLNKTLPVPIESEAEIDLFLRFHHEAGNIIYYSDDNLNDSIVLDPQWLIDAFKSLITAKMFCCRKPKILDKWIQFDESAILTRELVDAVWEKEENSVFHQHVDLLLDYLEKLGFIAKPRLLLDEAEVTDYYVAPCVLKSSPPGDLALPDRENRRSTSKLCFTTRSRFLPTAVFNKLLAACISEWPLTKERTKPLIFCGCGVFELQDNHSLYVYFFDHIIHIWITKISTEDQEPDMSLCSDVYAFLLDLLQNRLRLASAIQVFIRGQCSDVHSDDTMFTEDELAQKSEVTCSCRTEKHALRTYELTKYWHYFMVDRQQQVPTYKELNRMAHYIGQEYQSLGYELGLSGVEMYQVNNDFKTTVDKITGMLMKWEKKKGREATLETLTKAMEEAKIDAQDVLQSANIST